jgi:coenzyme F420-reducing hydrogenase alpha subunit
MNLEGRVHVSATLSGGHIAAVSVASQRPLLADRLLRGKSVDEALRLLPAVFALCGRTQAVVAAAACESAVGREPQAAAVLWREREVMAEMIHEHAWRLLLDWPGLVGEAPDVELLGRVRALLHHAHDSANAWGAACDAIATLLRARVLGLRLDDWLAATTARTWLDWADAGLTSTARTLRRLRGLPGAEGPDFALLAWPEPADVLTNIAQPVLRDPGFAQQPAFAGQPAECGPLPRLIEHPALAELAEDDPVAARAFARLAELVALVTGDARADRNAAAPLDTGTGVGWSEMARGLLTHVARVEDGRIAGYAIVAPTEWNFHPRGALPAALEHGVVADLPSAERAVAIAAATLDPCVALTAEVHHA